MAIDAFLEMVTGISRLLYSMDEVEWYSCDDPMKLWRFIVSSNAKEATQRKRDLYVNAVEDRWYEVNGWKRSSRSFSYIQLNPQGTPSVEECLNFHSIVKEEYSLINSLLRDIIRGPFDVVRRKKWGGMLSLLSPEIKSIAVNAYGISTNSVVDSVALSVLADALEESGYTDDTVLLHLRSKLRKPVREVTKPVFYKCPKCKGPARWRSGGPHFENELICSYCDLTWEPGEDVEWTEIVDIGPHVKGCWALDLVLGLE